MKILIDMNLPPRWELVFAAMGWKAVHWSKVGAPTASDREIMSWAKKYGYVVFTHDLDFSALLAATQGEGPSVIQVRIQNIFPESQIIINGLKQFQIELEKGAIVTVEPHRARCGFFPIIPDFPLSKIHLH